jgi:hypothetical protein
VTVDRYPYNFFKLYGGVNAEDGAYNIRITDIFGSQLIDSLITIIPGATIQGSANFPDRGSAVIKASKAPYPGVSVSAKKLSVVLLDRSVFFQASSVTLFTIDGKRRMIITADNSGKCYLSDALKRTGVAIIKVNAQ